jgi:hypothetical protein
MYIYCENGLHQTIPGNRSHSLCTVNLDDESLESQVSLQPQRETKQRSGSLPSLAAKKLDSGVSIGQ